MNLQQIIELLRSYDHALFKNINSLWANPFFDMFFPYITDLHRSPIAIVLLPSLIGLWIFRQRSRALKGLLALIIAVAAADLVSYRIIKALVPRDRPAVAGLQVELRSAHHSGNSFPSNHAANVFAAATMITFLHPPFFLIAFFIAISVAYSRVYVGVHFPSDVLAGAVIGYLLARFVWSLIGHKINQTNYEDSSGGSRFYTTRIRDGQSHTSRRAKRQR